MSHSDSRLNGLDALQVHSQAFRSIGVVRYILVIRLYERTALSIQPERLHQHQRHVLADLLTDRN